MAYKMPRASAFHMLCSPSVYVLNNIASVHGLWASNRIFLTSRDSTKQFKR